MQILEFHFNPKKEGKVFDSFVFEPESTYEKKVGNLYIAGEITNILSQNRLLLNNLASVIRDGYYKLSSRNSPLGAIKKGLQEANKFLEKQEKKGNISWLGNLNFAIISIKEPELNFTKTGNIKILLVREKEIIDIGKELEDKNEKSPSLKTFSRIVSGRVSQNDRILILTKEVFDIFVKEEILAEVSPIIQQSQTKKIEKGLKNIFNKHKKILGDTAGLFLLVSIEKLSKTPKEAINVLAPKKKPSLNFSASLGFFYRKKFAGFINSIKKGVFSKRLPQTKSLIGIRTISFLFYKTKSIISGSLDIAHKKTKKVFLSTSGNITKKTIILIILLIIVLVAGFFVSQIQKQKHIQEIQATLTESQEIMKRADNILKKNPGKANLLLQEAWQKISTIEEEKEVSLKDQINDCKKSIKERLFLLNKVEYISPQCVYEFKEGKFSPQRIFILDKNIYFFEPNSKKIYRLDLTSKKGEFINFKKEVKFASEFQDSLIFISSKGKVFLLENPSQEKNLNFPYHPVNIKYLSDFGKNLYIFDSTKKEVVKFRFEQKPDLEGKFWFNQKTEKPSTVRSMAIDGSIWLVDKDNNLWRFFKGDLRDKITFNIFPFVKEITKISTNYSLSYLYLLEPPEKRIIILDKKGDLVKQFISERFDSLKDISVDENGTVYILNNKKLYKIQI